MRKLSDTRFFQVLKYSSESEADMQKIEEYYDDFVNFLFQESKTTRDLFDFYNQQCYVRVELKPMVADLDYIDEHLIKNKCIIKVLELLKFQIKLTEKRLDKVFENPGQKKTTKDVGVPKIKWTGSNVELVELGYALFASESINNGDVQINTLMEFLSDIFDYDIKGFYHAYCDIRDRIDNKTIYISKLTKNLLLKIEKDDIKKDKRR